VPRTPALYRKAMAHLRAVDPVMAHVIERVGPITLTARSEGTHFDVLIRSIVYQQLSGKAAATIHGRVRNLLTEDRPMPQQIIALDHDILRGAGLSNQKARYVKNLAQHVLDGTLPVETLHELSDEEIIAALTQVKGIGRWSAQMFLMFRLVRPDVLPDLDLGVQKGIQRAYGLRKLPTPKKVMQIGAKWAPYRTLGAWYMWRVLERPEDFPATPKRKKKV
jgi:DNA-3-methyladenine glycosylase II